MEVNDKRRYSLYIIILNKSKRTSNQEFTAYCSRNTSNSGNLQTNFIFINNNNETKMLNYHY